VPKNWCFPIVVLEKTFESPLDSKEIKPVNPKGNEPWIVIGRTDAETEAPILGSPGANCWLLGKDSDTGKDWGPEEKGTTEDEMVGWHHLLKGHELEQTLVIVKDREAWCAAVHGVAKSHTWLSNSTTTKYQWLMISFILIYVVVELLSCVQLFCDPMDCSLPGCSVHRISQARILARVAISFSKGCSPPRDQTHLYSLQADSLHWANPHLLYCRQILYAEPSGKTYWYQFSSVAQSCPTLCDPMNCSTPGLPVHHQLPEFTQTHVQSWWWCHPAISSSVVPFSSCSQPLPASEFFPMSGNRLYFWGLQNHCRWWLQPWN